MEREKIPRPVGGKRLKTVEPNADLKAKHVTLADVTIIAQKQRNSVPRSQQEMILLTSAVHIKDLMFL